MQQPIGFVFLRSGSTAGGSGTYEISSSACLGYITEVQRDRAGMITNREYQDQMQKEGGFCKFRAMIRRSSM